MDSHIVTFFYSLLLTVAIEVAVLVFVIRKVFKISPKEISLRLLLFSGFIASFATLPYLWFVLRDIISDYTLFLMAGEWSIFLVEAVMYIFILRIDIKRAFLLSFVCNISSFLVGLLIQNT